MLNASDSHLIYAVKETPQVKINGNADDPAIWINKTNIEDSNYGLNIIDSLNPVTFEWNQRDGNRKGLKDLGFIAQDLQEVDDEFYIES